MIIILRKTVKITSGFSILIRQHYALNDNLMRGISKGHCPAQGYPRRWEEAEVHK